jgi:PAS domain S-box-containing protein
MKFKDRSREQLIQELAEVRDQLTAEKHKNRTILESVSDAFMALDEAACITYINEAGAILSGMKIEQLLGASVWDLFPHAINTKFKSEYQRAAHTKQPVHFEEFYPDPLNIWLECHGYPSEEGMIVLFVDITERKRDEETLHKSEERLKRSQQIAHLGSWEIDQVNQKHVWCDEMYRIFGLQPQQSDATYEAFFEHIYPDDQAAVGSAYTNSLRQNLPYYEIEHRIVRKSGEIRFVHHKCEHFRDVNGRIISSVGMIHDITERNNMEQALKDTNQLYELVVAGTDAAVWDWDVLQRQVTFSPRWKTMRGFGEYEIRDALKEWKKSIHPEDKPRVLASINAHLEGKTSAYDEEYRVRRKDGTWMWVADRGVARRDSAGRVVQMAGVETDITARKQAEESLHTSERRYRSLFQSMEAFALLEPIQGADGRPYDFRYVEINDAGARIRGMSSEQIRGRTILEMFPRIDMYWIEAYRQVALARQSVQFERFNQGNKHWYRTYAYLTEEDKVATLIIDITDRKLAEQKLEELTKTLEQRVVERTELAEARSKQLQTLAVELIEAEERERRRIAELLHEDLQQILAAARMQLQAVCDTLSDDPLLLNVQRLLEDSIHKTRRLSHELSPPALYHCGLVAALDWLAGQMREQFGLQVELELNEERQFESPTLKIFLFRAVQELLFNIAKHAGVKNGRVVLSGSDKSLILHVSDQGRGFDPEILDLPRKNPGLGLLSLRERVQSIGGNWKIESVPGQGSRFTIALPLSFSPTSHAQNARLGETQTHPSNVCANSASTKCLRLLFADDHEVMRKGLIRLVAGQPGIQLVGEASNGLEALELSRRLYPDLVVMDVAMPKMDGIEATRRIKTEMPNIRVIGLSMHDDVQLALTMRQAGAEAFLSKTASSGDLLSAIYGIPSVVGKT